MIAIDVPQLRDYLSGTLTLADAVSLAKLQHATISIDNFVASWADEGMAGWLN